jgi:hypothetical protein
MHGCQAAHDEHDSMPVDSAAFRGLHAVAEGALWRGRCALLTFLTVVTATPRRTRLSATQPAAELPKAITTHGTSDRKLDARRSSARTCTPCQGSASERCLPTAFEPRRTAC